MFPRAFRVTAGFRNGLGQSLGVPGQQRHPSEPPPQTLSGARPCGPSWASPAPALAQRRGAHPAHRAASAHPSFPRSFLHGRSVRMGQGSAQLCMPGHCWGGRTVFGFMKNCLSRGGPRGSPRLQAVRPPFPGSSASTSFPGDGSFWIFSLLFNWFVQHLILEFQVFLCLFWI